MVQLHAADIRTREVLQWKGVHLFHFQGSSCSQKTRIFLSLRDIPWESHYIHLGRKEQWQPWYLGINPRGLVPALVLDGEVHIESNDIIALLDRRFPGRRLIPEGMEDRIGQLLQNEDDLHLDIRTLNFRFTQPRGLVARTPEDVRNLREGGSGTVRGASDPEKDHQAAFWENVIENGLTDEAVRASLGRFRTALDELEEWLEDSPFLLGDDLTILDIAWFIYVMKLLWCGYPLERLHPRVAAWYAPLLARPEFAREIRLDPEFVKKVEDHLAYQKETGTTLVDVAGWA